MENFQFESHWLILFQDIFQDKNFSLDNLTTKLLIEKFLETFQIKASESTLILILIFFQEHLYLLEDEEILTSTWNHFHVNFLNKEFSSHVQGQILVTLTHIVLEYNFLNKFPEKLKNIIISLWEIISQINSQTDCTLRAIACQCLTELESHYPLLLVNLFANIFDYASKENTYIAQWYFLLMCQIINNDISLQISRQQSLKHEKKNDFDQKKLRNLQISTNTFDIYTFEMPKLISDPQVTIFKNIIRQKHPTLPRSSKRHKNRELSHFITKVLRVLIENARFFGYSAIFYMLETLVQTTLYQKINASFFINEYYLQLFVLDRPAIWHSFILLQLIFNQKNFPNEVSDPKKSRTIFVFDTETQEKILKRTIEIINYNKLSIEQKLICFQWLEDPQIWGTKSLPQLLQPFLDKFLPHYFEPIQIQIHKVLKYNLLFDHNSTQFSPRSSHLQILMCFQDYVYYNKDSFLAEIVFKFLTDSFLKFPSVRKSIQKYLVHLLSIQPNFIQRAIIFLDEIESSEKKQPVNPDSEILVTDKTPTATCGYRILISFQKLITKTIPPKKLANYFPLISRILESKSCDPQCMLDSVLKFIQSDEHYIYSFQRSRDYGRNIIDICRKAILLHGLPRIFSSLQKLLKFCSLYYNEISIRESARFYYQLIHNLSQEQLHNVLKEDKKGESVFSHNVQREELKPQKQINTTFLELVRKFAESSQNKLLQNNFPENFFENIFHTENDVLSINYPDYYKLIHTSSREIPLSIHFHLGYKKDIKENQENNEVIPQELFGLNLQLSAQTQTFLSVEQVVVPFLRNGSNESLEKQDSFPFSYNLKLGFIPLMPLPTEFDIRAIFSTPQGDVFVCSLDPIHLDLQDLFLPCPIPRKIENSDLFLESLFDYLWKNVGFFSHLENNNSDENENKNKNENENKNPLKFTNYKSVKVLQIEKQHVLEIFHKILGSFSIKNNVENQENHSKKISDVLKSIIFLPPKFFLMFKFCVEKSRTVVKIRSDFSQIFGYIDHFFNNKFK
ncbi:ap-5 complex subunit beta-1 [Anaeramoeba ignava]|uniref:Ap-5 complex subunit beta-1 n=1 Tax=Anaeramoeba ignava TaxID=1746090 RepID=A0A9Q0R9A9_ANAIG|nr:ap-5 complex subunit beta-1 [Anaeramoeba ignava]